MTMHWVKVKRVGRYWRCLACGRMISLPPLAKPKPLIHKGGKP